MTDEEHEELHNQVAEDVDDLLNQHFTDPACRAAVLLGVLSYEVEQMDDATNVQDVFTAMGDIVMSRMMSDHKMLNTKGSA